MSRQNHGNSWTKKDEKRLVGMLYEGASYEEMAKKLSRSWFACKCRLIKLKLIPFESQAYKTNVERYDVPLRYVKNTTLKSVEHLIGILDEEDTSKTFSNAELNIVIDYFKTRISRLAVQKLETESFQKGVDISVAQDIFTSEINKLKNAKTMTIQEREKVLARI